MVSDPNRGGSLELLLTKIKESVTKTQIIALSAVLENLNNFDKWLGAELIHFNQRPVELYQGVLYNGKFEYEEYNSRQNNQEIINASDLPSLVRHLLSINEQIVIIKNTVPQTQILAASLANSMLQLPASSKVMAELKDEHESETRDELMKTLRRSVAFHHADCEMNERNLVEQGFRDGHIRILVATTTLSIGVNLPCTTVILDDHKKWEVTNGSPAKVNWSVGEVRNIFGRAGRLLSDKIHIGKGIFIASNQREYDMVKMAYLKSPLEPLKSTLINKDITLRVLDVVASGYGKTEDEITDFIFKTFAAQTWKHESSEGQISLIIKKGIEKCIKYGLFEKIEEKVKPTELGKICASMGFSIESFEILRSYIQDFDDLEPMDLFFVASSVDEVKSYYYRGINWRDQNLRLKIQNRLIDLHTNNKLSGHFLREYERMTAGYQNMWSELFPSFTFALLSSDLVETNYGFDQIKKEYTFSVATIRKVTENIGWVLETIGKICKVIKPDLLINIERISECLLHRTPLDCHFLNKFSSILSRDEKIRLVTNGINMEDDFLEKDFDDFRGIISPAKANKIIQLINEKREKNHLYWEREHIRRLDRIQVNTEKVKEVYEKSGTDLEIVICDLLDTGFIDCVNTRITEQRDAEPDILLTFNEGEIFSIQVTAKMDNKHYVDSKKAGDVIPQSARYHAQGYICLGRPDFQGKAIELSTALAEMHNYKLLPMYSLVELYVRVKENLITPVEVARYIKETKGYLTVASINNFFEIKKF